jgi:hypothetical protein
VYTCAQLFNRLFTRPLTIGLVWFIAAVKPKIHGSKNLIYCRVLNTEKAANAASQFIYGNATFYRFSLTHTVMVPSTTTVPSLLYAFTEMGRLPGFHAPSGTSATQRISESAFAGYFTSMPFGIHRKFLGIDASHINPIAISSPLQIAITWTVPIWFSIALRFLRFTSQ